MEEVANCISEIVNREISPTMKDLEEAVSQYMDDNEDCYIAIHEISFCVIIIIVSIYLLGTDNNSFIKPFGTIDEIRFMCYIFSFILDSNLFYI